MYKRLIILLVVLILIISVLGCDKETSINKDSWKIGIITSSTIVNEEEYRAAEQVMNKYGEEHITHMIFPVKFMLEQDTVIDKITLMASDPNVKGIIISQGVPSVTMAIDKIRETRNDLLVIVCSPGDAPDMITSKADIVFSRDILGNTSKILELANNKGAKTFVYYSFSRHMSYELIAERRNILKEGCEKLGIKFIDVIAPDPAGENGVSGTEKFILEDVPKKIEEYGKQTAFYSSNCNIEKLLRSLVHSNEAIYPDYCCPSPAHGFPEALDIEIPEDKKGDKDYMIKEIKKKVSKEGMKGKMSVWPVSAEAAFIDAGAAYIKEYIDGKISGKLDEERIQDNLTQYLGGEVELRRLKYKGQEYENYILILSDLIKQGFHI